MNEWRRLYATSAEAVSPGMLPGSFKLLAVMSRTGPITLSALAERLTSDKGLLSRNVSELEDLGLVERTPDPHDGRVRLIALTPEGSARLSAAMAPHEERMFTALREWPVESIQQLSDLLSSLVTGAVPRG
jgi:DNA-binding MarR family transcriptional regulator